MSTYISPAELLKYSNGKKRLGGLSGDSAALNWFLAIGIVGSAICVVVWGASFVNAYNTRSSTSMRSYNTSYYTSQYALALGVLTLTFQTLYVLWVYVDGKLMTGFAIEAIKSQRFVSWLTGVFHQARHPMRKSYTYTYQYDGGKGAAVPKDPSTGLPYTMPGMGTLRFANLHRFTTSRLFAERQHIQKLVIVQAVFLVAWLVAFLLMAFKDGWLQFERDKNNHNVRVTRLCGARSVWEVCGELAKAGISAGVVTLLFLIAMVASIVAMVARKSIS